MATSILPRLVLRLNQLSPSEAIESHDPARTGPLINQLSPSEAIESHDPARTGPLINQLSPSEAVIGIGTGG